MLKIHVSVCTLEEFGKWVLVPALTGSRSIFWVQTGGIPKNQCVYSLSPETPGLGTSEESIAVWYTLDQYSGLVASGYALHCAGPFFQVSDLGPWGRSLIHIHSDASGANRG